MKKKHAPPVAKYHLQSTHLHSKVVGTQANNPIVWSSAVIMSLTLSGGVLQRTASGEFSLYFSVFSVKCSSLEFIFEESSSYDIQVSLYHKHV